MLIVRRPDGSLVTHLHTAARPELTLDADRRDEILAAIRAGEKVDAIEIDARVYRQQVGRPLREGVTSWQNYILFRPQCLRRFARSFRAAPYLSGHDWGDVRARAGTIADSSLEVIGESVLTDESVVHQTLEVVQPWAIEATLLGLVTTFSIGALPKGDILCGEHKAPIWEAEGCWCFPGDRIAEESGDRRVFWYIEDGEGVEVSAVNVPAVAGTGVDEVRAALDLAKSAGRTERQVDHMLQLLSARGPQFDGLPVRMRSMGPHAHPAKESPMKFALTLAALSLAAATATDEDAAAAVGTLRSDADLARSRLTDVEAQLAAERERVTAAAADVASARAAAIDATIVALKATGKVAPATGGAESAVEKHLRQLGASDFALFSARAAELTAGPAVNPAGAQLPAIGDDPTPQVRGSDVRREAESWLKRSGLTDDEIKTYGARHLARLDSTTL